jgi:hypothetical protein
MTDRANNDLAALLTPAPSKGVQFSQGKILTWDRDELRNTVEWRGITLTDLPMIEGLNNLVLKPGDVVGLMGWAPENAKGVGTWWIIGKLSNPGEFIADLTFYLGQVRFRTANGEYDQVYIGSDTNGEPLTIFYYGDPASTRALQIFGGDTLDMNYADGRTSIITSGTEGSQIIQIKDQAGNDLFASNGGTGGIGMADPWIPYHIAPTTAAQSSGTTYLPATTSASYVSMYRGFNPVYHPRVTYGIIVTATGTSEWQLIMNTGSGNVVVATGGGGQSGTVDVPGFGTTFTPGNQVEFVVNVRNTGGGTTHLGVDRLYGRQT